jgi:hypothetical protein
MACDAERPSCTGSELGVLPLPVGDTTLRHGREHEALSWTERDVPVTEVEVAGEGDLKLLADPEGAVRLDVDGDVGRDERKVVGARDSWEGEGGKREGRAGDG